MHALEIPRVVHRGHELKILQRLCLDALGLDDAGIGHKEVEAAKGLHDLQNRRLDGIRVRDIDGQPQGPPGPMASANLRCGLDRPRFVDIHQDHVGPFSDQVLGNLQAKALGRPRHHGNLAGDPTRRGVDGQPGESSDFMDKHIIAVGVDLLLQLSHHLFGRGIAAESNLNRSPLRAGWLVTIAHLCASKNSSQRRAYDPNDIVFGKAHD